MENDIARVKLRELTSAEEQELEETISLEETINLKRPLTSQERANARNTAIEFRNKWPL